MDGVTQKHLQSLVYVNPYENEHRLECIYEATSLNALASEVEVPLDIVAALTDGDIVCLDYLHLVDQCGYPHDHDDVSFRRNFIIGTLNDDHETSEVVNKLKGTTRVLSLEPFKSLHDAIDDISVVRRQKQGS